MFFTEVIQAHHPKTRSFDKAKQRKKIEGQVIRGTCKVGLLEDVSDKAYILNEKFVLVIKDEGPNKEVEKKDSLFKDVKAL